jgi:vacuole morphology and inheritance protein 14
MKDIVTEGNTINIEKFIPILSQRVRVINPECRKFVIGWIVVLNAVPDLDLLDRLPSFLDGIFLMLSDRSEHIREVVNATLSEFLEEIKRRKAQTIDYGALIQILVPHCTSDDELTCLTALKWIQEMIAFGKEKVLLYSAQLLGGILPSVSHKSKSIEDAAREANRKLEELIQTTPLPVQAQEIFKTIQYFAKSPQFSIPTRIHALRWILILHSKNAPELLNSLDELFQNLITTLSDPSEEVVRMDLQVLSKLSADESYFDKLMHKVLQVFSSDRKLLETRGNLIIRQLSLHIKAEKIYRALAKILETAEDPTFASTMIQILNLILLTSTELYEVREMLKSLATKQSCDLFVTLYKSWSHNAVALFSLCLLAQVYEHAARLVMKFGELEVTVSFLMEIDKLVQLLESPIFIYLRLQLLEPEKYPFLIKCLYGLLLLLPQSSAFETLKNRLSCISSLGVLQLIPRSKDVPKPPPGIDFEALLNHFDQTQKRHSEYIRKIRLDTEHALQQLYQTKKQVPLDMLDQSENATGASDIVTSVKRVMRRQIGSSQTVAPPPPPPGPNSNTSNVPQNETKANSEK